MTQRKIVGRSDLAEYAEAIGCDTDDIFAVNLIGENLAYVFYTPKPDEEMYLVPLARGEDGILTPNAPPTLQPDFFEQMKEGIKKRLGETFGPPDRTHIEDEG